MNEVENNYQNGLYYGQMQDLGQGKKALDIWVFTSKGLIGVHKEGVLQLLQSNGYWKKRRLNGTVYFCKANSCVIEAVTVEQIKDFVVQYVKNIPGEVKFHTSSNKQETITGSQFRDTNFNN